VLEQHIFKTLETVKTHDETDEIEPFTIQLKADGTVFRSAIRLKPQFPVVASAMNSDTLYYVLRRMQTLPSLETQTALQPIF